MDPLITSAIGAVPLGELEKRGGDREPAPRRKRPATADKGSEEAVESDFELDAPEHTVDDLV